MIQRVCEYNDLYIMSHGGKGQEFVHCFFVFVPSYFEICMFWN